MNNDERVLNTLREIISEVKQEMKVKKVITESKTPQDVFGKHERELKKYIAEAVFRTLKEAER